MYGALFVGQLWVKEELRHQGLETKLMLKAEDLAKESNCSFIAVNTFDWPGSFRVYKKIVFYVEFERHGFDNNSVFFLRKDLKHQNQY